MNLIFGKLLSFFLSSDYSRVILLFYLALLNNLMFLAGIHRDLYSDSAIYMSMARRFLEGDLGFILHPMWPPLYPLVSAFFYLFLQDWLVTARMVSVVFGSLLVIPIYFLTKNILGKYPALLICLSIIFLKPLTVASTAPLSEALAIFCFWSGFYLLWRCLAGGGYIFSFLGGVFWGLAYLTRPEGVFALIGFSLFTMSYFALTRWRGLVNQKRLLIIFALVLSGFLLVYAPFYVGMKAKYNKSLFSGKVAAIFNLDGGATKFNKDKTSTWAQDIWSLRTFNPDSEFLIYTGYGNPERRNQLFLDTWTRVKIFFQRYILSYFGILGIILVATGISEFFRNRRMFTLFSITVLLAMFLGMSFFAPSAQERYIYWTLPFFLICIVAGIKFVSGIFKNRETIVLTIIFFLLIFMNKDNFMFLHLGPPIKGESTVTEVDDWLTKNYPKSVVMAGHERVVFNNRGLLIYPPNVQSLKEYLDYANLKKVDFVIAAQGETPTTVEYLYKTPKNYPGLNLEYSNHKNAIYIYRVTD